MLGPQAAHPDKPRPPVTALAKARHDIAVIPTAAGDQLVGSCPPPPAAASQLPVVPFMAQGQMWVAVLQQCRIPHLVLVNMCTCALASIAPVQLT